MKNIEELEKMIKTGAFNNINELLNKLGEIAKEFESIKHTLEDKDYKIKNQENIIRDYRLEKGRLKAMVLASVGEFDD